MPCTSKAYEPRRSQPTGVMKTRHEHQLDRPSAERRLNRRERNSFSTENFEIRKNVIIFAASSSDTGATSKTQEEFHRHLSCHGIRQLPRLPDSLMV